MFQWFFIVAFLKIVFRLLLLLLLLLFFRKCFFMDVSRSLLGCFHFFVIWQALNLLFRLSTFFVFLNRFVLVSFCLLNCVAQISVEFLPDFDLTATRWISFDKSSFNKLSSSVSYEGEGHTPNSTDPRNLPCPLPSRSAPGIRRTLVQSSRINSIWFVWICEINSDVRENFVDAGSDISEKMFHQDQIWWAFLNVVGFVESDIGEHFSVTSGPTSAIFFVTSGSRKWKKNEFKSGVDPACPVLQEVSEIQR